MIPIADSEPVSIVQTITVQDDLSESRLPSIRPTRATMPAMLTLLEALDQVPGMQAR